MKFSDYCPLRLLVNMPLRGVFTTQKMKLAIQDYFSKCDQIRRKLIFSKVKKKTFLVASEIIICTIT